MFYASIDGPENLLKGLLIIAGNLGQIKGVVGHVRARFAHLLRAPDLPFTDFDEAPLIGQQLNGLGDKITREGIEHNIDPNPSSVTTDIVDEIQVYRTVLADPSDTWEGRTLATEGADAVLFTSSSTIQSYAKHVAGNISFQTAPLYFSIGPKTTKAMDDAGLPLAAEAAEPSLDSLIKALQEGL